MKALGPIQVTCDSPDYCIVQACLSLEELLNPCDCRWERADADILPITAEGEPACICGEKRPKLHPFRFTFNTDPKPAEVHSIGQCALCDTIWWQPGNVQENKPNA